LKTLSFSTPKDLGQWLKVNHSSESELYVKIFKKNTGIKSITWNDLVIEVLCWGWIDGVKHAIAEQFGITLHNNPKHPSSYTKEWITSDFIRGEECFILSKNGEDIGCVAFEQPRPDTAHLSLR